MDKRYVPIILTLIIFAAIFFFALKHKMAEKERAVEIIPASSEAAVISKYDKSDWRLILVNSENEMPENYEVDLVHVEQAWFVDSRIVADLQAMLEDARQEGLKPIICSAYRSVEKQEKLFGNSNGNKDSETSVNKPGHSEHNLGLAVDIVSINHQVLDSEYADTPEAIWLAENCYKYGFILRYPENASSITGVIYEPWHFRYVGKDAAKDITDSGMCFEKWLDTNP